MASDGGVLVTGAGGFIGGRIVEVLHTLGRGPVRAGVRRWSSAARIGRLPVEIVRADVTEPRQLAGAIDGVRAVVHCAVGPRPVIVGGTETLLEAARKAGLDRVVHLSTIDVYGSATGELDEESPLSYSGKPYGDAKIDAERACRASTEKGLPVTILRPSLVYGPFSESWTMEWARRLQAPPWMLAEEDCGGTCNLVYVDDLVGAILAALERRPPPVGAFNVNGPDRPTWNEYFHALNDSLDLPPLRPPRPAASRLSARAMQPVRSTAKLLLRRFDRQIMAVYQRSALAKQMMQGAEGVIARTPTPAELEMTRRRVSYAIEKAERHLGWRPRFALSRGLELTTAWLRHHGYVLNASVSREIQ